MIGSMEAVALIRAALEAAGDEFIPENGGEPGVRLRKWLGLVGVMRSHAAASSLSASTVVALKRVILDCAQASRSAGS